MSDLRIRGGMILSKRPGTKLGLEGVRTSVGTKRFSFGLEYPSGGGGTESICSCDVVPSLTKESTESASK